MIANLINTLFGIGLVYCAVLSPYAPPGNAWGMLAAGLVVIGLALWARRTDAIKWFSTTSVVLGALLLILGGLRVATEFHPLLTFWSVFWVGSIVSVFALWSALYNREASDKSSAVPARASTVTVGS